MKKFLLDYISALLNDGCNSLKIFIRDLDQRSNSIDMYQENSLPPTTRNVESVIFKDKVITQVQFNLNLTN